MASGHSASIHTSRILIPAWAASQWYRVYCWIGEHDLLGQEISRPRSHHNVSLTSVEATHFFLLCYKGFLDRPAGCSEVAFSPCFRGMTGSMRRRRRRRMGMHAEAYARTQSPLRACLLRWIGLSSWRHGTVRRGPDASSRMSPDLVLFSRVEHTIQTPQSMAEQNCSPTRICCLAKHARGLCMAAEVLRVGTVPTLLRRPRPPCPLHHRRRYGIQEPLTNINDLHLVLQLLERVGNSLYRPRA